jgi:hypothetical protein
VPCPARALSEVRGECGADAPSGREPAACGVAAVHRRELPILVRTGHTQEMIPFPRADGSVLSVSVIGEAT